MSQRIIGKNEKTLEITFVFLCFCIYFAWSLMQPYDSCPDERMRYNIPKFIFEKGTLPLGQDPSIRDSIWGISYGFGPLLPAIISSVFMKCISIFTMNEFALLMGARMVSILASTSTVLVCILISKRILKRQIAWLFVGMVSMLPQFAFISTYVNNDAMAIFSTALIVYFWVVGIETNWNIKSCMGLATSLSICALTYYNAYGFILISVVLFFWSNFGLRDKPYAIKHISSKAMLITGIVFLLAGWWFIRNYILYGDFFGNKISLLYSQMYAIDEYKPSNRNTPYNMGYSVMHMIFQMSWLKESYLSFIGRFGYMSISLPNWMYWIYDIIFLGSLAGLFAKCRKMKLKVAYLECKKKTIFVICMLTSIIIPVLLSAYYSYYRDWQYQGRYWLPMLIPFMFLVVKGLEEVSKRLHRFKEGFIFATILAIFVVIIACCFQIIPKSYV